MTILQKLQLRASEIRTRLAELAGLNEQTDETRAELGTLRTEYTDIETRSQAAMIAEDAPAPPRPDPDSGDETAAERELRALRGRVEFTPYLAAALERRGVNEGAELEYNQAMGLRGDYFPLEILAPEAPEQRAAIDGDAGVVQSSWIERLFADTAAMQLGITMPGVAPGIASYPVLGSDADPKQRGRAEAASPATITTTITEIKPTRNSVHAIYSVEDDARLPGLADAIRGDLSRAMTEKIDRTIFLGDSAANENSADIVGLETAGIAEITLSQANKLKGDKILALLAALIDGKYAASMSDINVVASVGSNTLWLSTIQNAAAENSTVAQFLRSNGVSWTTRGELEVATTAGKFGGYLSLNRGIANAAVAPVWNGAQLIVDPYSGAKSGEVQLTLSYLWGFAIPRVSNFRRLKYVA